MRERHPEEVAALDHRMFGEIVDTVLKYEGQVDRLQGEGVLAVFGLLQAHEDDAERAIRAALEIQGAARKLGLAVTAGIDTGRVTVGAGSSEPHPTETAAGPVLPLASRLKEQAQPGQLLVGEAAHHQSRRAFEFTSHSFALQGSPQPVKAYVVARALPQPQKARGIEGLRAELIGRERELAQLQQLLDAVLQPATGEAGGQMVSLIGEAGVGKSRLVAELRQGVRSQVLGVRESRPQDLTPNTQHLTPLWLEGRCLQLNMTTGYSLFLDLLRGYFGWRPEEPERERSGRLVAVLREFVERGELAAERAEEMEALLANLLSLRFGDEKDLRLKHTSPEQVRHQTLQAVQVFLVLLARRQPVVLVLEDLHWADPLSLDLISLLMEALRQVPLLLLCIYRPEREHRCGQLSTIASRKCPERYTELMLRELTPP
jgi:hypothetical protein